MKMRLNTVARLLSTRPQHLSLTFQPLCNGRLHCSRALWDAQMMASGFARVCQWAASLTSGLLGAAALSVCHLPHLFSSSITAQINCVPCGYTYQSMAFQLREMLVYIYFV